MVWLEVIPCLLLGCIVVFLGSVRTTLYIVSPNFIAVSDLIITISWSWWSERMREREYNKEFAC